MTSTIEEIRIRRNNGLQNNPSYGEQPTEQLTNRSRQLVGWTVFLGATVIAFVVSFIITLWIHNGGALLLSLNYALMAGMAATALYYVFPILRIVAHMVWHRRLPTRDMLDRFSKGQLFVCWFLIAFGLFFLINHAMNIVYFTVKYHHFPHHITTVRPFVTAWWHVGVIVFVIAVVLFIMGPMWLPTESQTTEKSKKRFKGARSDDPNSTLPRPFGLWFGRSTGELSRLWHRSGIEAGYEIVLNEIDAAQNTLVLGGIGAGKTTRFMQPILAQLLDQSCGGLIFDVKGDVKSAVLNLAETTKRPVNIIGPGRGSLNLLAGLTPEIAASFLKSVFLLSGGYRLDSFWIDTATELCRNTLGLLSFFPKYYTLHGLYNYLFDEKLRRTLQAELDQISTKLSPQENRLLKAYARYHEAIFSTFDDKVKGGVNATVAQALAPFNHPELIDAFCQEDQLNLQSVVDGAVYLVDMPLSRWGLGGKVAYTFIKLQFFNIMQRRYQEPNWDQERPVFFMCDEYQELISASQSGLSDLNFWDKSRSSKTLGIVSSQSVSSFYAALGNRDLAHAILQNFRQKICFRTEDEATLSLMDRIAGRAKVLRKTTGYSSGTSKHRHPDKIFSQRGTHSNSSETITETRESVLDAVLFRNLSPNQAVALLSINGYSMDDVLELQPLYV